MVKSHTQILGTQCALPNLQELDQQSSDVRREIQIAGSQGSDEPRAHVGVQIR